MMLNSNINGAQAKAPKWLVVTLTTGAAVACSTAALHFTRATFFGYKAVAETAAPTNNTSTAYLGYVDTANTLGADAPAHVHAIAAGASFTLESTGTQFNFADLSALGATGDFLIVVYWQ